MKRTSPPGGEEVASGSIPKKRRKEKKDPADHRPDHVVPFWSPAHEHLTGSVWQPTASQSRAIHKHDHPNASWGKLTGNTWFTTYLWVPEEGCPTYTDEWTTKPRPAPAPLPPDNTTDRPRQRGATTNRNGKDPRDAAARMMKTQVLPTKEQAKTLLQWFGVVRWTYNQCVSHCKKHGTASAKDLRDLFVAQEAIKDKPWLCAVPQYVRDEGVRDYLKAVSSNEAKKKNAKSDLAKSDKDYKIRFRSKKTLHQETCALLGRHAVVDPDRPKELGLECKTFPGPLQLAESLPLQYFSREEGFGNKLRCFYTLNIVREKTGKWYLCLPLQLDHVFPGTIPVSHYRPPAATTGERRVVAIDPGVKPFICCYSPHGETFQMGTAVDIAVRLEPIAHQIDLLQSKWTKERAKRRYRLKKAARKRRRRLKNLQDEIHRKAAKLLVANYDEILLPSFETSKMVEHGERVLKSKTVRQLLTWSHYRFRQLLIAKAREREGVRVLEVSEAYTSKTCGCCGAIHDKLGANKLFACPSCGFTIHRDVNGARNIFLRNMGHLRA